jgi:hypothetical protein
MSGELGTTNLLLAVMAGVSLLEAIAMIAISVTAYTMYRRFTAMAESIEVRHLAPTLVRLNAILDDLKIVATTVKEDTERVDTAIHDTMERLDDTADRLRSNVRVKTRHVVGVVRGVRAALEEVLRTKDEQVSTLNSQGSTINSQL